MEATALQLFEINQRTLSVWYNNLQKKQERAVLSMDLPLPVAETIKQRRERSAKADDCLVGFGAHKTCTYKELYESADREKKSYVQCLRGQSCKLGSKMDTLKKYIQKRDVDKAMPGCSLPRPGPSRVQSPKAEPTDDELMACALEVDIPAPPPAPVTPPAPLTRSRPPRKAAQKKSVPHAAPEVRL
ncbi:hypothetical protein MHYP_G00366680 [Metynnis hypsauchen]